MEGIKLSLSVNPQLSLLASQRHGSEEQKIEANGVVTVLQPKLAVLRKTKTLTKWQYVVNFIFISVRGPVTVSYRQGN